VRSSRASPESGRVKATRRAAEAGGVSELFPDPGDRYRVRLLRHPELTAEGVLHEEEGSRRLLPWRAVRGALAADVGEPEGVRTIVFDLCVEVADGVCSVWRLDAEPGGDAMGLARRIRTGLAGRGDDRVSPSLKSVADDGLPTRWYPDLASFEADAAEELAARPRR